MIERVLLILYLICAAVLVHIRSTAILAEVLVVLSLLAWTDFRQIFKRAFLAIWLFNGVVTIAYAVLLWIQGESPWEFVLLFNLRVLDITFMTLLFSNRVNIVKAVSFSQTLVFLLTASLSLIGSFRKTFNDFQLALKSRTLKPLKERKKREFLGAMTAYFFKKAMHNAEEVSLALKARGYFDRLQ